MVLFPKLLGDYALGLWFPSKEANVFRSGMDGQWTPTQQTNAYASDSL